MKLTTQFRESEYRKQQVISPVPEPRKQLLLDPGFDLKSGFQRRRLLSPLHVHSGSHTLALDKHKVINLTFVNDIPDFHFHNIVRG